jgi:SAM-dependent methyltransferase
MLNRRVTNLIRFILDELLPPIVRDNKYFMYPLCWIWFKGKNVKKIMEFKSRFHQLSEEEFADYYKQYEYISNRPTDLSELSIQFIIHNLGEDKTVSIADIACGTCYVLKRIKDTGYHNVHGIDIASQSCYDDIEVEVGNIEHLQYPDHAFDIVICSHTLEHVSDLSKTISELKRVAAKKIIITVPKQRYYRYTFDLHLNFFPQISYLLKYFGTPPASQQIESKDIVSPPPAKITWKNIKGDWTVIYDIE